MQGKSHCATALFAEFSRHWSARCSRFRVASARLPTWLPFHQTGCDCQESVILLNQKANAEMLRISENVIMPDRAMGTRYPLRNAGAVSTPDEGTFEGLVAGDVGTNVTLDASVMSPRYRSRAVDAPLMLALFTFEIHGDRNVPARHEHVVRLPLHLMTLRAFDWIWRPTAGIIIHLLARFNYGRLFRMLCP